MAPISKQAQKAFRQWGQRGGKRRAQRLSATKRQAIARMAAQQRWQRPIPDGGTGQHSEAERPRMTSVRLDQPRWDDPVYLVEILEDGTLLDWRELRRIVAEHPFGSVAMALGRVLEASEIYGTKVLWTKILCILQGGAT
jgi:hypothetical protein